MYESCSLKWFLPFDYWQKDGGTRLILQKPPLNNNRQRIGLAKISNGVSFTLIPLTAPIKW